MHTLITSADLVTLNPERSSTQAKVHVQDIHNITLSVDNDIGHVKRGFPRFPLVHFPHCHSSQHHLLFTSSCQITFSTDYVLLMLFQRNGRRRLNLVVIGS